MEVVPVRCFFWHRIAGYSAHPVVLLFRRTQIFGDYLPNTIPFHVQLTRDHSNWWLVHSTCLNHSTLTSALFVKGFLPQLSFYSSWPSMNILPHTKVRMHDVVSPYTCWRYHEDIMLNDNSLYLPSFAHSSNSTPPQSRYFSDKSLIYIYIYIYIKMSPYNNFINQLWNESQHQMKPTFSFLYFADQHVNTSWFINYF